MDTKKKVSLYTLYTHNTTETATLKHFSTNYNILLYVQPLLTQQHTIFSNQKTFKSTGRRTSFKHSRAVKSFYKLSYSAMCGDRIGII